VADYTNLMSLKLARGVSTSDTTQDGLFNMLIPQSTALINEWIGRDLTQQTYTEFYKGNGQQYLPLNQRPVALVQLTATLTASSTTVTVPSTSKLIAGMPVSGTNPTPVVNPPSPAITPGTTIASLTDATTLVLSSPANVSGSQTLYFGVSVWSDDTGYWGQSSQAFSNQTYLTPGVDYALDVDQPDGTSRSGLLYRIGGNWSEPWVYQGGVISPFLGPASGNLKVVYTAGYKTVPAQLTMAANTLIGRMIGVLPQGAALGSESVKDYSYTLAAARAGLMTPEVTEVLAKFMDLAV
jgi:hypothetical protein